MDNHLTYWRGNSFYINPTSRCTNRCLFCVRNLADGVFGFELRMDRDPEPDKIAQTIHETWNNSFNEAVIVGFGEPLLNLEGTLEAVRTIKSISNASIRINTNGQALLFYPDRNVPRELNAAGVNVIRVSVNAHDEDSYMKLCCPQLGRSAFNSVLEFAGKCSNLMELEISAVELPGIDIDFMQKQAERMGARFHLRNYHGPPEILEHISQILAER
ncbi:MAG: radical SAM protein [Spirochaetota bacterium]|nr:MAG: radical SAM protein [Spirochaetota bacterium]